MKKLYLITLALLISNCIHAQNYVPLLIDSLYSWTWNVGFEGDTIIQDTWRAYSYDSNDSLVQLRRPVNRFNYSYGTDTVYLLAEILGTDGNWGNFSRSTKAYEDGQIISQLTEKYENDDWENSAWHTYTYDDSNIDNFYLLQHWDGNMWINFYKRERLFNADGNNTEESEYYAANNGIFTFNRGKLYEYDNDDHLIQEISLNASNNGPYQAGKITWEYGGDDLVDSVSRCQYEFNNNDICNNVFKATYDYSDPETTVESLFNWIGNDWKYYGKNHRLKGPEIYSNRLDSLNFYEYSPDSQDHILKEKQSFKYEDLGNDMVYFKEEKWEFKEADEEWVFTKVLEEWYHLKSPVHVADINDPQDGFSCSPNPCFAGQEIQLDVNLSTAENLDILVFDQQGRLVSKEILNNKVSIQAPKHQGIYNILIRKKGVLLGVVKQVVIE